MLVHAIGALVNINNEEINQKADLPRGLMNAMTRKLTVKAE